MTKEQTNSWEDELDQLIDKNYPSVRSYTAGHFHQLIKDFISKTISQEKEKMELYKEAYEELLELRGYLTTVTGNFEPNISKLKKYWGMGKSDWEKKLNLLQNK